MILDFFQMHNQFYQYYLLSTILSPVIDHIKVSTVRERAGTKTEIMNGTGNNKGKISESKWLFFEKIKGIEIRREEVKLSLFLVDMFVYVEYPIASKRGFKNNWV